MKVAFGTDETTDLTDFVVRVLGDAGHEVVVTCVDRPWPEVGRSVGEAVASGVADRGVVCCWTGTGVSIAANKVPGVRAALCGDAETARGARAWNDANVLCLSLRTTTPILAREIIDAWVAASRDGSEAEQIARIESA